MPSTEMVAGGAFDLTRAPQERWNEEMVKVVAKNVFRGHEITEPQLYFCLSVAEAIELNPMIGEIYFLPSKSRDAKGPAWTPYVGRNGLVNKADRAGCYFESDTVHANDDFEITRQKNGVRTVRHSYSQKDRGEIVGAYAFLHDRDGSARPAFFYAQLSEYLPTFDAEWKLAKSPWGNQTSALIEKCAMLGAGRKRLRLGNVLSDGEIEKVQQMASIGPGAPAPVEREFSWAALEEAGAARGLVARLRDAVEAIREVDGSAWPPAKVDLVATGMSDEELAGLVAQIEAETVILRATVSDSPAPEAEGDHSPAEGPGVPAGAGSDAEATVAIVDAVEVSDAEHVEALRVRAARLEERLADGAGDDREQSELNAELDAVTAELEALENPDQEGLWS